MRKLLFTLVFLMIMGYEVKAEILLGLGYAVVKLPSNNGAIGLIAPNGETTPGTLFIFGGTNEPDKVSLGFSTSGYSLKKWVSDYTGRVDGKWNVMHYIWIYHLSRSSWTR